MRVESYKGWEKEKQSKILGPCQKRLALDAIQIFKPFSEHMDHFFLFLSLLAD